MGRTADLWQCTPYNCSSATIWNMHYNYNLAGDIKDWTNASGTTFTHTISNAQRITQITSSKNDATHPGTVVSNITYAPQGEVSSLLNGCVGTGCVQRKETYDYNKRLQAVRIQLGTSATANANHCWVYNWYSGVANPTSCTVPTQGTSGNNGSVVGQFFQNTTNPSLGHTAAYTYDTMSRLKTSVATGSSTHNLTFSYDRYGNMTCVTGPETVGPCPAWTYNTATNRLSNANYAYDAAGDLTQDGGGAGTHTYQWQAENRMKSVDSGSTATYTFNALGRRVESQTTGPTYREFVYDPQGVEVGRHDRSSTFFWQYLFLGDRRFGKYQDNKTYFFHQNHIGTTGTVTDEFGSTVQDVLYYPWGQEWNLVGTMKDERFASLHRRDAETSSDPTLFRMFSSRQGRWFSTDPIHGRPDDPQSLNLYGYVRNSPTNYTDPKGDCWWGWCDPFFGCYCDPFFGCTTFFRFGQPNWRGCWNYCGCLCFCEAGARSANARDACNTLPPDQRPACHARNTSTAIANYMFCAGQLGFCLAASFLTGWTPPCFMPPFGTPARQDQRDKCLKDCTGQP